MRGCGSGDPGRGPEAAGAGAGAGNWLGCEWRQRRHGRGPDGERVAPTTHPPGQVVSRAVSAFHPLLALQVGRLRPGEAGGQPSPAKLRTGGAESRLPQFSASGLHSLSLSGIGVEGGKGGDCHLA